MRRLASTRAPHAHRPHDGLLNLTLMAGGGFFHRRRRPVVAVAAGAALEDWHTFPALRRYLRYFPWLDMALSSHARIRRICGASLDQV